MLRIDFAISPELADALMEVARYDALCDAYPLLPHLRRQIEERGDLRWIWAVALREGMHRTGHEILQALQKRSPACIAPWEPVVCRIGELAALVRKLGASSASSASSSIPTRPSAPPAAPSGSWPAYPSSARASRWANT